MGIRARNKDTGAVLELQDGKWVEVVPPRTSVGNAIASGVEGNRAVGDYLNNLIKSGVSALKGLGPTKTPKAIFSRQGGTLQQEVQATSGIEDTPQAVKRAALPIVGGFVAGGPGAGIGELINQAFGIGGAEPSVTEAALATISPPGARGIFRGGKAAVRGGAGFVAPQAMRESGVELVQARFSGEASRQLFNQTLKQGKVPTEKIGRVLERMILEETATATPRKKAIDTLTRLKDKLTKRVVPRTEKDIVREGFAPKVGAKTVEDVFPVTEAGYKDVIEEVQRLRRDAQINFNSTSAVADPNTGVRLSKAANAMIEELDNVSPVYRQANAAFRREESIKALSKELRKGNPGVSVRTLFEQDDLVRGTFSVVERQDILNIADDIGRFGTGATLGAGNRALMAFVEPAADLMTTTNGRKFLRVLIQQPGMTANKAAEAMGTILNQMRRGTIEFTDTPPNAPTTPVQPAASRRKKLEEKQSKSVLKDTNVSLEEKVRSAIGSTRDIGGKAFATR